MAATIWPSSGGGGGGTLQTVTDSGNITTNSIGIGSMSTVDRQLHVEVDDATNNGVTYVQRITHTTSGTPQVNIGVGIEFEVETSANNNEVIATIEAIATTVTAGSEAAAIVFKTMTNGAAATEQARITRGTASGLVFPTTFGIGWVTGGTDNCLITQASSILHIRTPNDTGHGRLGGQFIIANAAGTSAVASAQLEIVSTSKGLLIPRMTTAQKAAISSPANHLLLVDTDLNRVAFRSSSAAWWTLIASNENANVAFNSSNDFGTNATNTVKIVSGVAPSTSLVNSFQIYSADIVAGNAAPHFRTENGGIVKLYTVVNADFANTVNTGDADTDDLIDGLITALTAHGLIAAA